MQATVVSPFHRLRSGLQEDLLAGYDELIARMAWDRQRIHRHQRERLQRLLRHAAAHSPFHAERLAGLDLSGLGPEDLSVLPVMTKAELMAGCGSPEPARRPRWRRRTRSRRSSATAHW